MKKSLTFLTAATIVLLPGIALADNPSMDSGGYAGPILGGLLLSVIAILVAGLFYNDHKTRGTDQE